MAVKGFQLVKTLIIAYVITAVLLLLTAFGLYRLHLSDWQVMAAVVCSFMLCRRLYFSKSTEKQKNVVGHGLWYFIFYRADGCRLYSYKRGRYGYDSTCKGTDCLPFGRWSRSICNA